MKSTAQTCNLFPQIVMKRIKLSLETIGIDPMTSYMQSMRSSTDPHIVTNFAASVFLQILKI